VCSAGCTRGPRARGGTSFWTVRWDQVVSGRWFLDRLCFGQHVVSRLQLSLGLDSGELEGPFGFHPLEDFFYSVLYK